MMGLIELNYSSSFLLCFSFDKKIATSLEDAGFILEIGVHWSNDPQPLISIGHSPQWGTAD